MIDALIKELTKVAVLSNELIDLLRHSIQVTHLEKGEHFLKIGQVSNHLAYVHEGLTMLYQLHEGNEIPMDFLSEGSWVAYLKSFTERTASDMGIKTLEDTILLTLSKKDLETLTDADAGTILQIKNHFTTLSFMKVVQHTSDLSTLDATMRYNKFVRENPKLINRIPLYHIAAYLGIKPPSLSRIRNNY